MLKPEIEPTVLFASHPIDYDEVNPETITDAVALVFALLEHRAESLQVAVDWNTASISLSHQVGIVGDPLLSMVSVRAQVLIP